MSKTCLFGLSKFWIWSSSFQKYTDGPCGLHFITQLVPNFCQKCMNGLCGLQFVTHLVSNLYLSKPLDLLTKD
ncbi:hypothetical protein Hanom_Chr16g01419881 [Helianthus anomalus]